MSNETSAGRGTPFAKKDDWKAYTMEELRGMTAPEWIIPGIFPEQSTVLMYGKPSAGKSFVILDMVLSVATGRDWHGLPVKRGKVVYAASESGPRGYSKRIRAWEQHAEQRVEGDNFCLVPMPVNLMSETVVESFIDFLNERKPVSLVVIDTLSKSTLDAKSENDNTEMARAVAGAERIARDTGATVVLVHHTGKSGETFRGASSLEGNTDARFKVTCTPADGLKPGGTLTLTNERQKEVEPHKPITLRAALVKLDNDDSSLVLVNGGTVRTPRENTASRDARILAMRADGKSIAEIAEKLGIQSEGTVRSVISRKKRNATSATRTSGSHAA